MGFARHLTSAIMVVTCVAAAAYADASCEASNSDPKEQLRWCNIQSNRPARFSNPPMSQYLFGKPSQLQKETIYLHRPRYSGCVAVIEVDWTGHGTLNPKGFSYGVVPPPNDITPAQIEQMWSETPEPSPPATGLRRYKLSDGNAQDVLINMSFEDNKLIAYNLQTESGGRPFGATVVNSEKLQNINKTLLEVLTGHAQPVAEKNINAIDWHEVWKMTHPAEGPSARSHCTVNTKGQL